MAKRKPSKASILVVGLLLVLVAIFIINSENFSRVGLPLGMEVPVAPLKIGTSVWPGYEPLFLARDLGYYENSPVRLVEYTSATQVIRAYRNSAIQAAVLTLDEVLLLVEDGLDPRVVLVMDISHGGDVIIAKPEIKSLSEIRGHKVGVENTALGGYFLTRALETVGLKSSDVGIIFSEVDEHETMFLKGDFDAVVTFTSHPSGTGRVLMDVM